MMCLRSCGVSATIAAETICLQLELSLLLQQPTLQLAAMDYLRHHGSLPRQIQEKNAHVYL
jgi:hypothetical protein